MICWRMPEKKGERNDERSLQEMIADAREEGRKETMNGLQEMIADAREEGRKETMNGLQEMIARRQRRRAKGNDERFAGK